MATIHVDVVSAEELIFSGEATFVALPGEAGELGIKPRHTPLITRIKPGSAGKQNRRIRVRRRRHSGSATTLCDRAVRHRDSRQGPGRRQGQCGPRCCRRSTEERKRRAGPGTCPVRTGRDGGANCCPAQVPRQEISKRRLRRCAQKPPSGGFFYARFYLLASHLKQKLAEVRSCIAEVTRLVFGNPSPERLVDVQPETKRGALEWTHCR